MEKQAIYVPGFVDYDSVKTMKKTAATDGMTEEQKYDFVKKAISSFIVSKEIFIKQQTTDIHEFYDIKEPALGEGAFGTVFEGVEKDSGERRAIKRIQKSKIINKRRFYNEIEVLKVVDHPNIIRLYDIYQDDDYVYLVQEL